MRALVAFTCAAVAACGGSTNTTNSHSATPTGTHGSGKAGAGGHAPSPIATADAALGGGNGPQQYRISIYDLRRDGPFAVLDFGLTCLTPGSGCSTLYTFSPHPDTQGPAIGGPGQDEVQPSGVFLVDPVGERAYYPVRDSGDHPFTSQLSDFSSGDSGTHLEWVRYPAPPASVSSVDVVFPNGGPQFTGVPVSSGAGPSGSGGFTADPPATFSQPPSSTNASGLTLPVAGLVQTVGNQSGSDTESPSQASLALRSDVLFHFDKANLTATSRSIIDSVATEIKSRARGTVQVTGYTDSIGSDAVNIPLSLARARAVLAALRPLTPGLVYAASGKGSADPVAPNTKPDGSDNPAGRALNRRVTIAFAVKAAAKPAPLPQAVGSQSAQLPPSSSGSATFTVPNSSTYQASGPSLFRDGSLLGLRMSIRCQHGGGSPPGSSCNIEGDLGGTETVPPQVVPGNQVNFFTVSAFYLEDPATGAIYIPLRDSYSNPVTGNIEGANNGSSFNVWAYYPAPPPSVSSLTLVTPEDTARIPGVPIAPRPPAP